MKSRTEQPGRGCQNVTANLSKGIKTYEFKTQRVWSSFLCQVQKGCLEMKTKTKQKSCAAYLRSVALSYQCATVPNPTAEDMPTSYLCFAESNVECGGEKNSLPWLLLAVRHSINQSDNCFFRFSVRWYCLVFAQAEHGTFISIFSDASKQET